MAHEALKFNVIVSNVDIWQPIVGAKDHGTFYMVYIRFNKVEEINKKFHYSAEFKLQNYDGDITMGFVNIPRIEEISESTKKKFREELEKDIPRIEEELCRKLTDAEKKAYFEEHRMDFKLNIPVQPFNNVFYLESSKLNGISKPLEGNVLESNCDLTSPNFDLYDSGDVLNSLYINPYHYRRSGDEIIEIGTRNKGDVGGFTSVSSAGTKLTRCNPSRSFLI